MKANATLILGIAALPAGILGSVLLTFEPDLSILALGALALIPTVGIVLGQLALRQSRRSAGPDRGREKAVIGLTFAYTTAVFMAATAVVAGPFELSLVLALRFRPANCEIELRAEDPPADRVDVGAQVTRALRSRLRRLRVPHDVVFNPPGAFFVRLRLDNPPLEPDRERRLRSFFEPGLLSVHLVHPDNDTLAAEVAEGRGAIPAGFRLSRAGSQSFLLRTVPDLVDDVSRARATLDSFNRPAITISFGSRGRDALRHLSSAYVGRRLAIAVDDTVITAPEITGPIEGGEAQITGEFSPEEASELVNILSAGVLPHRLKVVGIKYFDQTQSSFTLFGYSCEPRDSLVPPEGAAFSWLGYTCRRMSRPAAK